MKNKVVIKSDLQKEIKVIRTTNGLIVRQPKTDHLVVYTN